MDQIAMLPDYLPTTNISLYTLPVAWLLCLAPRIFAAITFISTTKKPLDMCLPRGLAQRASSETSLDAREKNRIIRAEAAQANGLENVGYFATAVVAGNFAGLDRGVLNGLSVGYLVSRVVFSWIYVVNETTALALLRTAVFFAGQGMIFALYILAGNKLR